MYSLYSFHHIFSISWFRDAVPWYQWYAFRGFTTYFPRGWTHTGRGLNEWRWRMVEECNHTIQHGNIWQWPDLMFVFWNVSEISRTLQISSDCFEMFVSSVQTSPETLAIDLRFGCHSMAHGPSGGTFWGVPGRPWPREKGSSVQCRSGHSNHRPMGWGADNVTVPRSHCWCGWCLGMLWCINIISSSIIIIIIITYNYIRLSTVYMSIYYDILKILASFGIKANNVSTSTAWEPFTCRSMWM